MSDCEAHLGEVIVEEIKLVIIFGLVLHAAEDFFRFGREKSFKKMVWGEGSLLRRLEAFLKQLVRVLIRCSPLLYYSMTLYDHF